MKDLICPACGTSNPADAIYCRACFRTLITSENPTPDKANEWLNDLRNSDNLESPESDSSTGESDSTPEDEGDIPDWLARIRQRNREENPPLNPEEEPTEPIKTGENLPDWLNEIEPPAPEPEDNEKDTLPDWLNAIDKETASGIEPPASENKDWLEQLPFESQLSKNDSAEDDWLNRFRDVPPISDQSANETSPQETGSDEFKFGSLVNPVFQGQDSDTPLPLDFEGNTQPEPPDEKDIPDWLKSFDKSPRPSQPSEQAEDLENTDKNLIASEQKFSGEDFEENGIPIPPDESAIPGWLTSFDNQERPENIEGTHSTDWMQTEETEDADESASLEGQLYQGDVRHKWLDQIEPQKPTDDSDSSTLTPPTGFSLNGSSEKSDDDLNSDQDQKTYDAEQANPQAFHDNGPLEEGELPDWLKAIQPAEAASLDLEDSDFNSKIETKGPLAGFQGILPGRPTTGRYPSPVQQALLQVTEKQRSFADLLENVISQESVAQSIPETKKAASFFIFRLLIGIAIIALITFTLLKGNTVQSPYPGLFPLETVSFFNTIQTLSSSEGDAARVLVAVDYEAGLAGELNTLAEGTLQDLAAGGARLTFLSDIPAGAALSQQLVNTAAANAPNFQLEDQYINLGYLPGGTTALASLAANPQQTVPVDLNSSPAWGKPGLVGITKLSDFNALVLITDSGENARAWIEQVGSALGETPLLVISSAQSAPIVQPYVQSQQVAGMISGLAGAASYEQLAQRSNGSVRKYWDAYQTGLILMVAMIVLGGLVQIVRNLFTRPRNVKKS